VVPLFNEETVIKGVIDSLHTEFDQVICIDDGSSDN